MTNDTSLESSCALLLESAKEFANLQQKFFFLQNPCCIVNMFAKKNGPKNDKIYILKSP